jgi:hypothetical protein
MLKKQNKRIHSDTDLKITDYIFYFEKKVTFVASNYYFQTFKQIKCQKAGYL